MKSMTCYGRAEARDDNFIVSIDARGVNNRFRDINLHLPPIARSLELSMKQVLSKSFHRGRLDVYLKVKIIKSPSQRLRIDYELAREINDCLMNLKYDLELSGDISVDTISRFKDLFQFEDEDLSEPLEPVVLEALEKLILSIDEMKKTEGKALEQDFKNRLTSITNFCKEINEVSGTMVKDYRKKLETRIKSILEEQVIDKNRLEQEICFLAERSDISEELTRLESHINQFHETIGTDGAIGKKLDFILQEMNREVNTIASKSSNTVISSKTIDLKTEIEKIREQVQNVE